MLPLVCGGYCLGGNGNWNLSLINARISPPSQATVMASAQAAKVARLTVVCEVVCETRMRNPPITKTLVKYENMAMAMVAMGSRFTVRREITRWIERKMRTVRAPRAAPQNPERDLIVR